MPVETIQIHKQRALISRIRARFTGKIHAKLQAAGIAHRNFCRWDNDRAMSVSMFGAVCDAFGINRDTIGERTGGDIRFRHLAEYLSETGYNSRAWATQQYLETIHRAHLCDFPETYADTRRHPAVNPALEPDYDAYTLYRLQNGLFIDIQAKMLTGEIHFKMWVSGGLQDRKDFVTSVFAGGCDFERLLGHLKYFTTLSKGTDIGSRQIPMHEG